VDRIRLQGPAHPPVDQRHQQAEARELEKKLCAAIDEQAILGRSTEMTLGEAVDHYTATVFKPRRRKPDAPPVGGGPRLGSAAASRILNKQERDWSLEAAISPSSR
jgi:hypothetical protein